MYGLNLPPEDRDFMPPWALDPQRERERIKNVLIVLHPRGQYRRRQWVLRLANQGESYAGIARALGVCRVRVKQILARARSEPSLGALIIRGGR